MTIKSKSNTKLLNPDLQEIINEKYREHIKLSRAEKVNLIKLKIIW